MCDRQGTFSDSTYGSGYVCLDGQRCDWCGGYLHEWMYGYSYVSTTNNVCLQGLWCSHRCHRQARSDGYEGEGRITYSSSAGCFITTAVCSTLHKGDDCAELTSFRQFRDGWLTHNDGQALIEEYYHIAPQIVAAINTQATANDIYAGIWDAYLQPAFMALEVSDNQGAKDIYVKMVRDLQETYLT